jgi:hypothetical protein
MKKNNALMDEKDRIDVFNGPLIQPEKKGNGENGEDSGEEDDCVILEYK